MGSLTLSKLGDVLTLRSKGEGGMADSEETEQSSLSRVVSTPSSERPKCGTVVICPIKFSISIL